MGPFSSYWVASSSLDGMVCAWSCCSILCWAKLISLGGLLFCEGGQSELGSGGKGRWDGRETGEVGERGNCGWDWDVMHERIIIKINKQTKSNVPPTRLIKN